MIPAREFIAEQRLDLPLCVTKEICSGGTYIVTGGNTGLGYETAKHFVSAGAAKVIIAVRNVKAGETAKVEIEAATKIKNVMDVWVLDLANYASAKAFCKRAVDKLTRIDAVVQNAGVALDTYLVAEGHESSVTINVFSTMLLAVLLMPKMMESAQRFKTVPHITIVTSEGFTTAKAEIDKRKDNLFVEMDKKNSNMADRYALTKLIQVYVVRHLATLLPVSQTGVVINVVNPGMCKTSLARNAKLVFRIVLKGAHALLGRTAEMGSRTILFAAVAGKESHGCYTSACAIKEDQVPDWAKNEEAKKVQKRVWEDVARELERIEPGCVTAIL